MSSSREKLTGAQRLLEAGLLICSVLAMYLMLALFTFDPADPGWSQTGYQTPVRNLGGSVGAYLSDLLLNLFGVIAYTLPFRCCDCRLVIVSTFLSINAAGLFNARIKACWLFYVLYWCNITGQYEF